MGVPYKWPLKKSPASDSQRELVYRMESEAIGAKMFMRLSPDVISKVLRSLCKKFHVPPVRIEYKNFKTYAAEWESPNIIRFSKHKGTARDLITVLHEFAHHMHAHYTDGSFQYEAHGPEFMTCYIAVLDVSRYMPTAAMRLICDNYKIKYLTFGRNPFDMPKLKKAIRR